MHFNRMPVNTDYLVGFRYGIIHRTNHSSVQSLAVEDFEYLLWI